ncbi:MAG: hypothetical protein AAF701_01085 [Pseudomonadota bacterium]
MVFGTGVYDIWDFVVSGLCLWFGLEAFQNGYADKFGRLLVSANVGISGTFFVVYAAAFMFYFAQQWWYQENPPVSWFYVLPITEHKIPIDSSGRYSAILTVGEIIALVAIIPAYFLCSKPSNQ